MHFSHVSWPALRPMTPLRVLRILHFDKTWRETSQASQSLSTFEIRVHIAIKILDVTVSQTMKPSITYVQRKLVVPRTDGGGLVVTNEILVHVIDTSSLWLQLCELQPLWGQLPKNVSDPLHCTSSSQIGPIPGPYLLPIVCPNLTATNTK